MRVVSILLVCFVVFATSCSNNKTNQSKGIQKHFVIANQVEHSYEIYLPAGYDSLKTYPTIFSFDSHGNGSIAIDGFKEGADRFGFVIVGSNTIRNGIPDYNKKISALVNDVKNRFAVDTKAIFTAGFSGGARMANYYGLQNLCAGIISCGAGFHYKDIQRTGSESYIYNIAGTRDGNFSETAYLPNSEECVAMKYISVNFTGIHEWPSANILSNAIEFMYVRLVIDKICEENTVTVSSILDKTILEIDSLKKTNNKLALYKKLEFAAKMFADNGDGNSFMEQMTAMNSDKSFIESLSTLQQALQMESMLNDGYVNAMKEESIAWWERELKALNDSTQSNKKGDMVDMMYRSKAFIGMICYSFTSSAAKEKNIPQLEKMLTIYQMAESKNPDMFYYKAYLALLKSQNDSVISNMKKAYEFGFEDSIRLKTDFPVKSIVQIQQYR